MTHQKWQAERCRKSADGWNVIAPGANGEIVVVADYLSEENAKAIAALPELKSAVARFVASCPSCAGRGEYLVAQGHGRMNLACDVCAPLRAALSGRGAEDAPKAQEKQP